MSRTAHSTGLLVGSYHERGLPLRGRITKQNAAACIARLVVLATEGPGEPIVIYIDSQGGSIRDSLSIIATMNGIKCPVATFCYGMAGGTAAMIFAHGTPGLRAAKTTSQFSFKLPQEKPELDGTAQFQQMMAEIVAQDARQQLPTVLQWLEKGIELDAKQALANGLLDFIASGPVLPQG
jgi:ATP-dependent Clp protease protease subunit